MATQDLIEVIGPGGSVAFYELSPEKGVLNIGRHPDNDIVLDGPGVAPYQAILDCRQRPFRLVRLSAEGDLTLGGSALPSNVPVEMSAWDHLEAGGFVVALLAGDQAAARAAAPAAAAPLPMPATPSAAPPPAAAAMVPVPSTMLTAPVLADIRDEVIVTEVSTHELATQVEQSAVCQLTIVNGGPIVATFIVQVTGVDPEWVQILPAQVNLYEGERANIRIAITPPRLPTSRAGMHEVAVVVTSPNHAGRISQTMVALSVAPYTEFTISELVPRRQSIAWSKRAARTALAITNRGNCPATFRLSGEDDEHNCRFEFLLEQGGVETALAKQADVTVPIEESTAIPVRVTPLKRRLVGLRGRTHFLTVSTAVVGSDLAPRSLMAQLVTRPLLGFLHILILVVAALLLIGFAIKPRIIYFQAAPAVVYAGEPVTLKWLVSPFSSNLRIEGWEEPLRGPLWEMVDYPTGTVVQYSLRANNFLSQLLPFLNLEKRSYASVVVVPQAPVISLFEAEKTEVARGVPVTIYWAARNADDLTFQANNNVAHLPTAPASDQAEEDAEAGSPTTLNGTIAVTPTGDTLVVLEASNAAGSDLKSIMIRVVSPEVLSFDVYPSQITLGDIVTITWAVTNAATVNIAPLADPLPPKGQLLHAPEKTTDYILTAKAGQEQVWSIRHVVVNPPVTPPTPTPVPTPVIPIIEFFTASPAEVIAGNNAPVQLAWSVLGPVTDVQIASVGSFNGTNLEPRDIIVAHVNQTTIFVLTAIAGDQSVSTALEVKALPPTPLPTATATPTPTLTPTPTPTFTPTPWMPPRPSTSVTPTPPTTPTPWMPPRPTSSPTPTTLQGAPPTAQPAVFLAQGAAGFENTVSFQYEYAAEEGPVRVYSAARNAGVLLNWDVPTADSVALDGEDQPIHGSLLRVCAQDEMHRLTALLDTGEVRHFFVSIQVVDGAFWAYLPLAVKRAGGGAPLETAFWPRVAR